MDRFFSATNMDLRTPVTAWTLRETFLYKKSHLGLKSCRKPTQSPESGFCCGTFRCSLDAKSNLCFIQIMKPLWFQDASSKNPRDAASQMKLCGIFRSGRERKIMNGTSSICIIPLPLQLAFANGPNPPIIAALGATMSQWTFLLCEPVLFTLLTSVEEEGKVSFANWVSSQRAPVDTHCSCSALPEAQALHQCFVKNTGRDA